MVPIAVLTAVIRQPVVEILFGSGRIRPADLDLIAVTLTAFLIGLTAHAMIAVLARAFYARQDTATPVAAAVGAVAINCTLAVVLVGPLGLPGIALAIAIAAWIEALVLLAILYRRLHHFELRGLGRVGVESVVGSVAAGRRRLCRPRLRPTALLGDRAGPPRPDRRGGHRERRLRGRLRRGLGRLADPGTAVYRRGHGRRAPPPGQVVTAVEPAALGPLRRGQRPGVVPPAQRRGPTVKAVNGWSAHRIVDRPAADRPRSAPQILVRRPRPMPWGFAYAPARSGRRRRGTPTAIGAFTAAVRAACRRRPGRVSHVRIDPEIEVDGPLDPDGALAARPARRPAGDRRRPSSRTPPGSSTCAPTRTALWGDLRKKWRQYVNKARTGGHRGRRRGRRPARRVLPDLPRDGGPGRLPDPRRIRPTATCGRRSPRAGNARLLFAQTADGEPQATLFLVRCGPRVVEPYGGMTAAGAESRANYLLKWEAIRSSREAGATSYDLWGLATGGIAHFKTGFGGREVRYIGAWDLVLSPVGRRAYELAQRAPRRLGTPARRDHGDGGSAAAYGGGRLNVRDAVAGRAGRLGRASPSRRPAATSTSRGRGPSIGAPAAGSRGSSSPTTEAGRWR